MKKIIITTLLIVAIVQVYGQSKIELPKNLETISSKDTGAFRNLNNTGSILLGTTFYNNIAPHSIVWHWCDSKMPMTWLPKPNMTNIDSVEIYVSKKLTYWLNDSTLIIKKP